MNVEKEADFACGGNGALEHQDQILRLLPFPGISSRGAIHDEYGSGFQDRIYNAQAVRPQRCSCFRNFDDGISELRNFYLGCAPGKFDAGFYAMPREVVL